MTPLVRPTSTSRPTSGSRHRPDSRRVQPINPAGQRLRTIGSSARYASQMMAAVSSDIPVASRKRSIAAAAPLTWCAVSIQLAICRTRANNASRTAPTRSPRPVRRLLRDRTIATTMTATTSTAVMASAMRRVEPPAGFLHPARTRPRSHERELHGPAAIGGGLHADREVSELRQAARPRGARVGELQGRPLGPRLGEGAAVQPGGGEQGRPVGGRPPRVPSAGSSCGGTTASCSRRPSVSSTTVAMPETIGGGSESEGWGLTVYGCKSRGLDR